MWVFQIFSISEFAILIFFCLEQKKRVFLRVLSHECFEGNKQEERKKKSKKERKKEKHKSKKGKKITPVAAEEEEEREKNQTSTRKLRPPDCLTRW